MRETNYEHSQEDDLALFFCPKLEMGSRKLVTELLGNGDSSRSTVVFCDFVPE
jgi:hypothetical protein